MAMTKAECARALKGLMEQYDKYRKRWIKRYGTDTGYDQWFTGQVRRIPKSSKKRR